jgi:hypothetical protein
MLVSGRMARAFSKMALKANMDALASSPSRCLKSKINEQSRPQCWYRAFSKMAEKSSMDALAGRPSRCLENKVNVNRAAQNVGVRSHGQGVLQDGAEGQHGCLGGQSLPLPKE